MSWWVMEQVSVNEAGTQTLANIQCDDVSDLPAPDQSATLGYIIVRGSQAKVLATSENYILGSTGTWVKIEDGVKLDLTGYATEQYVDDELADKIDISVYSSGQAAQDAEIDTKITMQQAYGYATAIPANSDLNNYITPGIYYALVVNVPTITNTPYSATGLRLVVEKNTLSGAAVFQTLYPTSKLHLEFYRRVYESGSWSSWYRFIGEVVAVVQSSPAPRAL